MQELIDRQAVLAEIGEFQIRFNETGDSHERVAYATAEHCMLVIKAAPTIEADIDRAAIMRLCNEIEDTACDIGNQTMNDVVYAEAQMIFDKVKEIGKELTGDAGSKTD